MPNITSRRMKYFFLTSFCFLAISLSSCEKNEGEGGTSEITGKIYEIQYDASFQLIADTVPYVDEDVFIIYGNHRSTYDDDFKTSFDGSYKFSFLQKGDYILFAYSDDSTGASTGNLDPIGPKSPTFIKVTIDKNGKTISAPDLYIIKNNR